MKRKKFTTFALLMAFTTLSSNLVAQSQQPSSHPLLDKYYPQPKQPANSDKPKTTTVTSLAPSTTSQKPVSNNSPVSNSTPALQANITDPGPAPTTTIPASTTTIVNKPATTTNNTPVQQTPAKSYDPNSLYDTRLGSSSPQYDTYEKNSYGAGTVTTSPK